MKFDLKTRCSYTLITIRGEDAQSDVTKEVGKYRARSGKVLEMSFDLKIRCNFGNIHLRKKTIRSEKNEKC